MAFIPNGTPQLILLGTNDLSGAEIVAAPVSRPTHLPLCYFYARRAYPGARIIGDGFQSQYHTDTFDPRKKYFNSATAFVRGFLGKGNAVMAENIIPADAKKARVRLSIEVADKEVDIYERNDDGSIKYEHDAPKTTGSQEQGHVVRFVVQKIEDGQFGKGTMTSGSFEGTSSIYPLIDFEESAFGEDGNDTYVNIFTPVEGGQEVALDARMLKRDRFYPFAFRLGRKTSRTGSVRAVGDMTGAVTGTYALKNGAIASLTDLSMGFANTVWKRYNRKGHPRLPDHMGFLGNVAVYQSNIETLLRKFYESEKAYVDKTSAIKDKYDFVFDGKEEHHLFNMFGGSTYSRYPYHTFIIKAAEDGYLPTSQQWIGFKDGADGTMSKEAFAEAVVEKIGDYADRFSPVHDDARRVESVFYDPGLPLAQKYKLLDLLAIRKDLALGLAVYEEGAPPGTAAENYATAAALRARAQLYPESVHFGTGVSRVLIMGYSGELTADTDGRRYPCLYEVAMKSAEFMGAGNRIWRDHKRPTGYPGSIVNEMTNIDVDWSPIDQRIMNWDVGLNWIQNYDQNQKHIPAFRTVYGDDTSVLTGWFHNLAIVEINKVCQQTHRKFSGRDDLSNAQLARLVDEDIANELKVVFGSRYRIEVETKFTDEDIARNYSWTTCVRFGAAGQKTVMTAYVEAYRIENFPGRG